MFTEAFRLQLCTLPQVLRIEASFRVLSRPPLICTRPVHLLPAAELLGLAVAFGEHEVDRFAGGPLAGATAAERLAGAEA